MNRIVVIGCNTGLSETALNRIKQCRTVFSAKRFQKFAPGHIPWFSLSPVNTAVAAMESRLRQGNVAVLAGGDPLFFGIGRRLIATFGAGRLEILPDLAAVQLLCARVAVPWDDARFLSLHGRPLEQAAATLLMGDKTVVLTDTANTPATLVRAMLTRLTDCGCTDLADDYTIIVGEELGLPDEQLFRGTLQETADRAYAPLNLMLTLRTSGKRPHTLFPGEQEIRHSRGLVTKDEVRAVVLQQLDLPERGVLWDVGAGSGSVGLSAASLCPDSTVFAVEQQPEEIANIRANIRRHRFFNLLPVPGRAPEVLASLPDPDRVFIGGSNGTLAEILAVCHERLPTGGVMVVNAVLTTTRDKALAFMTTHNMTPSASIITVERLCGATRTKLNTITVITGRKK